MTLEEMAVLGMARTSEITDSYPATRSLMYRRVGLRQRALMALAARENPDYYGVCAESPLDENLATDLNDIVEPVPTPELIQMVTIENPGTSEWAAGREVAIVSRADVDAELAPRMTLRDLVLQQVGTDLVGVVSVMVFYSRLSPVLGPLDRDTAIELQSPWDQLLEIDLTLMLLAKATRVDAAVRAQARADLEADQATLLAGYLDHVRTYAPVVSRFGATRPPVAANVSQERP